MRVDEFLTARQVPFTRLQHRPAYTANRIAQMLHVPGNRMAKSVLLRSGPRYVLAVVPSNCQVDIDRLRKETGEPRLELATERDMERVFPDCERGAMPPFGSLYQIPTVVDDSLACDKEIVVEGPNHEEAIRMTFRDYVAAEHPQIGHFAAR